MSGETTTPTPRPVAARKGLRALTARDISTQDIFAARGFQNPQIVLRWREFAGPVLGRLTAPLALSPQGLLTISADPSIAILLQHQTQLLVQRINMALGGAPVVKVKVVSGKFPRGTAAPPAPPLTQKERDWAVRVTNGVQDAGLRAALERFAQAVAGESRPKSATRPIEAKVLTR